jgi:hypothetical protein
MVTWRSSIQKRRLRAGRRAVHFVHQEQIRENRSPVQRERARGQVEHICSHNVGRHQIGGTLHALKFQSEYLCQRFYRQRLCQPRYAFHQRVPAHQQDQQHLVE